MGFMNVSIGGSDAASDFAYGVGDQIAKAMEKELRETHSEWNTSGACNVALFFDEVIIPSGALVCNDKLRAVARRTLENLEGSGWFGCKDRNKKLDKDFRRLTTSLKKFLKEGDDLGL